MRVLAYTLYSYPPTSGPLKCLSDQNGFYPSEIRVAGTLGNAMPMGRYTHF